MAAERPDGKGNGLRPHPEYVQAIDMVNSIRVLRPDMSLDKTGTWSQRRAQFDKMKHILEDYEFCEESGKIVRVR